MGQPWDLEVAQSGLEMAEDQAGGVNRAVGI